MYVLELGGQDDAFAAREAASAASGVERLGAGLARARGITDRVGQLAFTHRASELVALTDPDVAAARAAVEAASIDRSGSVAVRAVDVRTTTGVDTQRAEREVGQALVDRGFSVDLDSPDHELRVLFAGPPEAEGTATKHVADAPDPDAGVCALGWLVVESERDFAARAPTDRPFFQPGSMDPMLARALVNMAGAREGRIVLDPMCGTGGLLTEAGLVGARVLGTDAQDKMVRGTRQNLADALGDTGPDDGAGDGCPDDGGAGSGGFDVCRADARRLPLRDEAVDAAVFDAPYGRQSKVEAESLAALVADALAEVRRVAPRAVVVGDRSWREAAESAGWAVENVFERRVHRSLDRYVHLLS